jgi:hypothetical protein
MAVLRRQAQQPTGETPGVAVAPVALAGAIMPGFARVMLTLSLHAAEFGVGMTLLVGSVLVPVMVGLVLVLVMVGSMLVPPSSVTTG